MSLNNRIYFREHQSSGRSNVESLPPASDTVRVAAVTHRHPFVATPQSQGSEADIFTLSIISRQPDIDIGKGDATSIY